MRRLILGPPGTGKTSTLIGILRDELERGTPPGRIGYVSYTKAAIVEATSRIGSDLGIDPGEFRWARTLHSACYLLRGRTKVLGPKDVAKFAAAHGYDLSGSPEDDPAKDDLLLGALDWSRAVGVPLAAALAQDQFADVQLDKVELFAERYFGFKHDLGAIDFADMLADVRRDGLRPSVDVLIVDESQDLSPVQSQIVELWGSGCERVYVAGDDDQAIYSFSGGDPAWLLGLARTYETRVLAQSWRIPASVHALAERIAARIGQRVAKEYRPRDEVGEVSSVWPDELAGVIADGAMVLGRTRKVLRPIAKQLRESAVPFYSKLGVSPLDGAAAGAVRLCLDLLGGRAVRPRDFDRVLEFVPMGQLAPRGTKKRAKERQVSVSLADLSEMGLGALQDALVTRGPVDPLAGKMSRTVEEGLDLLVRRHGCLPEPAIELSTVHRAKGREHRTVAVISDWGAAPSRALERRGASADGEHRCAYVAATRAKQRLVTVQSIRAGRDYRWPLCG